MKRKMIFRYRNDIISKAAEPFIIANKSTVIIFIFIFSLINTGLCQEAGIESKDTTGLEISKDSVSYNFDQENPFISIVKTDSLFSFRSPKGYFPSLINDFALQASAPVHFGERQWVITGVSVGMACFLLHDDNKIDEFARVQKQDHKMVAEISPRVTRLGGDIGMYSVIGAGLASAIIKDPKGLQTSLLASQAVITSGVWVRLIKILTGRERPMASYNFSKTEGGHWYGPFAMIDQDLTPKRSESSFDSFPSGHTATAFSIATVVATQYKDTRAVPVISYSLASLVGVSRLIEHEHWASDVLVGGLIGYACGKQVTSAYNRLFNNSYSRDSIPSRKKTDILISGGYRDLKLLVRF